VYEALNGMSFFFLHTNLICRALDLVSQPVSFSVLKVGAEAVAFVYVGRLWGKTPVVFLFVLKVVHA
jgi:hypothetical protein